MCSVFHSDTLPLRHFFRHNSTSADADSWIEVPHILQKNLDLKFVGVTLIHFNLNLLSVTALASLATTVIAQAGFCPEASRFGTLKVSQTTLFPGQDTYLEPGPRPLQPFIITSSLGQFLDYYVVGTSPHNIGGPIILLARRTYHRSMSPPMDMFTTILPAWFYSADATYSIWMYDSFARPGSTGQSVITVGSIEIPINIAGF
ncbi:hypothetical protein B0H11DRAFT_1903640 [Mycena galericulata]|nr:hypothetical protein B0H11DRAFT_1903640 [Mycena galericulata]